MPTVDLDSLTNNSILNLYFRTVLSLFNFSCRWINFSIKRSTVAFYHYPPSGEFVNVKLVDDESEYYPKQDEEEDEVSNASRVMEDLDLEEIPLLETVSTPIMQAIINSLIHFFDAE
ncbi:MAG: hypothetical protein EXX96DRAFT_537781 [Benjaminiella poitrasii]|nr:MAG: hypothetical protein EXX96DRAFT_537781 [Benjaminiella poitrasii]